MREKIQTWKNQSVDEKTFQKCFVCYNYYKIVITSNTKKNVVQQQYYREDLYNLTHLKTRLFSWFWFFRLNIFMEHDKKTHKKNKQKLVDL